MKRLLAHVVAVMIVIAVMVPAIPATALSGEIAFCESNETILHLVNCESSGRNICIVDSNGKLSCGILQFQQETWEFFSKLSSITGSPRNPDDAIRMGNWAIKNGYGSNWSCWRKIPHKKHFGTV